MYIWFSPYIERKLILNTFDLNLESSVSRKVVTNQDKICLNVEQINRVKF